MAMFCLIHGGGGSAESWKLVREELTRRGHASVTPALPLDRPEASGSDYAEEIARQVVAECGANPPDLVAVAHSVSGFFLPLLPERLPLVALIYLAAMVPQPGLSAFDQVKSTPDLFHPGWRGKDPRDPAVAREFLFHDCPDELLPWAHSTVHVFYPKRALEEITPLKAWPDVPVAYIACSEDRTISPAWQMRVARERLRVEPRVLPGGHCPYFSRPRETADALVEAFTQVRAAR